MDMQDQSAPVTNIIVNTQPTTSNKLMLTELKGQRPWSTGLFDCCDDVPTALLTCFFLPCMEYKLANQLGEFCLMPLLVCGSGPLAMRIKIRTMGGIRGSILSDSSTIECFTPCAVCQMLRELEHMGIH